MNTTHNNKGSSSLLAIFSVIAAAALLPVSVRAVPYASGITNDELSVSFFLNEAADDVTVVVNGGSLDLGPLAPGQHTFGMDSGTPFELVVKKCAPAGWTLISSDSNPLLRFNSPRGVAVNRNVNSPAFGRIYVANSAAGVTSSGRSVGDGLYLLNADQSDALGRGNAASTAGLIFTIGTGQANSPWHIEVGPDSFLYIADFSVDTGTIYRTDPDVSAGSGINMLANYGTTNPAVHTTIGSSPVVSGSLATGDLTIWAIDGRFPPSGNYNRLYRWDVEAGPLPYTSAPTALANPLINFVVDVTTDLDRGPDGKFYMMQNRSAGNEAGLVVVASDGVGLLWNSLTTTRSISNNPTATDILRISRAIKVSPDGSKIAIIRDDLQTWVIPLVDGIPDLQRRLLVTTYTGAPTTLGRDVCFDAAGNLYALSSGNQLLRIFSPGGRTTAITRSDGTFTVSQPHEGFANSGVDDKGALVPIGAVDPHITIVDRTDGLTNTQAYVVPDSAWLPNDCSSSWLSATPDRSAVNNQWTFRVPFDLTGYDLATLRLEVRVSADNQIDWTKLNGSDIGFSAAGFGAWSPLLITSGFVPGVNHLDFRLNDSGGVSGFRMEFLPVLYLIPDSTGINVYGTTGTTARIEYASELPASSWTPLTDVVLTTSPFHVSDPDWLTGPQKFYRAVRVEPGQ